MPKIIQFDDAKPMRAYFDMPNFKKYRISPDGFVVNASGQTLHPNKGGTFCLRDDNGQRVFMSIRALIYRTFVGEIPPKHHVVCISSNRDYSVENLRVETKIRHLHRAQQKAVVKLNSDGEIVDVYRSGMEAANANYLSSGSVYNRCNGHVMNDLRYGFTFRYEDKILNAKKKPEHELPLSVETNHQN